MQKIKRQIFYYYSLLFLNSEEYLVWYVLRAFAEFGDGLTDWLTDQLTNNRVYLLPWPLAGSKNLPVRMERVASGITEAAVVVV